MNAGIVFFMIIYFIVNKQNGKVYVGQTTRTTNRRWTEHKTYLRKNEHQNPHLQSAWNKYGESSFAFEEVKKVDTIEDLNLFEAYYIELLFPKIYNLCSGGSVGRQFTEETKSRMSNSAKLRKRTKLSQETRRKISEAHTGKCVSNFTRKKLSATVKNQWKLGKFDDRKYNQYFTQSPEYSNKMSKITRPRGWDDVVLISPNKNIYENIFNLKLFCKTHDLHYGAMRNVIIAKPKIDGSCRTYSGWKIIKKINNIIP